MSNTKLGLQLWFTYTKSQFSSMCRSLLACTELYATVAGVGFVMRANTAPGGRETSEMERLVKAPGFFSTRRRRLRSGWTQAGISEEDLAGLEVPFEAGVRFKNVVAGDIVGVEC
jgi:hypothetical protein